MVVVVVVVVDVVASGSSIGGVYEDATNHARTRLIATAHHARY